MRLVGFGAVALVSLLAPAVSRAETYTLLQFGDPGTQAVAINSRQEVLVMKCVFNSPCTAFLWSQKTGPRAIVAEAQSFSGLHLNDRGDVAGVQNTASGR